MSDPRSEVSTDSASQKQTGSGRITAWFKRLGVAGFLFFLIKGLIWIAIWIGAWMGFKTCGKEAADADSAASEVHMQHLRETH